jgi:hypothetical protein
MVRSCDSAAGVSRRQGNTGRERGLEVVEEVEEGSRGSPYSLIGRRCTRGEESKSTLMAAAAHPIWGRERERARGGREKRMRRGDGMFET